MRRGKTPNQAESRDGDARATAGLLVGRLEPSEQASVEASLAIDPELRRELEKLRTSLRALDDAAEGDEEELAPPPGLGAGHFSSSEAHAAWSSPSPCTNSTGAWKAPDYLIAAGIFFVASMLVFPAIQNSRAGARLTACQDKLRLLGVALAAVQPDSWAFALYSRRGQSGRGRGLRTHAARSQPSGQSVHGRLSRVDTGRAARLSRANNARGGCRQPRGAAVLAPRHGRQLRLSSGPHRGWRVFADSRSRPRLFCRYGRCRRRGYSGPQLKSRPPRPKRPLPERSGRTYLDSQARREWRSHLCEQLGIKGCRPGLERFLGLQ